jgi:flagellar motility protein MotE (MotC chaperone)
MKKIVNVIVLALAMNFLLVVGAGGWLFSSGHLDKAKFVEVKKILFPPEVPVVPATQPAPTTGPASHLDELLAKATGRTVNEQVDSIRQAFAAEEAELDRRTRELQDLQRQVDLAKDQARLDRTRIEAEKKDVDTQQAEEVRLAADKGFQDSLALYNAMKPKQVKTIFMTLSDDTVVQYLRAMDPRTATKITAEFKLPEEITRIQKVMEKIRQSQPVTTPAGSPQAAVPVQ